jgi:hypothetical protein
MSYLLGMPVHIEDKHVHGEGSGSIVLHNLADIVVVEVTPSRPPDANSGSRDHRNAAANLHEVRKRTFVVMTWTTTSSAVSSCQHLNMPQSLTVCEEVEVGSVDIDAPPPPSAVERPVAGVVHKSPAIARDEAPSTVERLVVDDGVGVHRAVQVH